MRFLLDTNIIIPLFQGRSDRLPKSIRDSIAGSDSPAVVSVASLWEVAIKTRVGKLALGLNLSELPQLVENWGFVVLSVGQRHALVGLEVDTPTRDPFDRMLLAQCQVEGLRLVTLDRVLTAHPLAWRRD